VLASVLGAADVAAVVVDAEGSGVLVVEAGVTDGAGRPEPFVVDEHPVIAARTTSAAQ
jgi:hypothetical protein